MRIKSPLCCLLHDDPVTGRACAFQVDRVHRCRSPFGFTFCGSPEDRTQRDSVISQVWATSPRLPFKSGTSGSNTPEPAPKASSLPPAPNAGVLTLVPLPARAILRVPVRRRMGRGVLESSSAAFQATADHAAYGTCISATSPLLCRDSSARNRCAGNLVARATKEPGALRLQVLRWGVPKARLASKARRMRWPTIRRLIGYVAQARTFGFASGQ
jgi:hypothetical protein